MLYRSNFINQYIKFISNKPIYYIGFYSSKKISELELKEPKVGENKIVNDENKEKSNDIKEPKSNAIDDQIKTDIDNFKDDIKNINSANINENNEIKKNNETFEKYENNIKKDKKENGKEIEEKFKIDNNIYEEETNLKSDLEKNGNDNQIIGIEKLKLKIDSSNSNYYLYDKLNDLPLKITIFELKDTIFGEYLKYEKEDINLLRNLNKRMNNVEKELGSINMRLNKVEKKIERIEGKVDRIDNIESNLKILMSHFNLEYKEDISKNPQLVN